MFPDGGEISVISDPADSHMGGMEGEDLVPQVDNLSRMLASPYSPHDGDPDNSPDGKLRERLEDGNSLAGRESGRF
ncbi:hypothetical protein A7C99_6224 [Trichophyton rubrum]|uniref:Uncharacterized protein n=1 Tax=Trichophyton rubrum TaxID=5551 RepID=A0A178EQP3_TRIRU|nr:hypothetical protein A7C99_6224 [Trichophyton rubrum]